MFASPALAQDTIKLKNGDELTGSIKTMSDGKITFGSPMLGDVVVPLDSVDSMTSAGPIKVRTTAGESLERRIESVDRGGMVILSEAGSGPRGPIRLTELEAFNLEEKPIEWTGSVAVNGVFVTGNTERRQAGAAFDAERRSKVDRVTARGRWDYAEDKNAPGTWTLNQRRTYGGLKYDFFLTEKWFATANTSAEGDFKANLDLRLTAGLGIGRQIVERDDLKFSVELGVSYFYEDYRTGGPPSETAAGRAAYDLMVDLGRGMRFLQNVEGFVGFETTDDVHIKKNSRLQANLTESMFGELGWLLTYDNTPAPGNDRVDQTFSVSVGWTF
jgi:putative salt-induced outer membrane protein YdiY